MLENTNKLNDIQLEALARLTTVCKQADGSTPNTYTHILNQPRLFPASLLYYDKDQLIGFLSAYFFYEHAVELSVMVHPKHRRNGIAKAMLNHILPLIKAQQHYEQLIFSSPAQVNTPWLVAKEFTYRHSEYYMERNDLKPLLEHKQNLLFRNATSDDIPLLSVFDELCFPGKQRDATERFQALLNGREYQIILIYSRNKPVGKAHLRWDIQGATLSDIAVHPEQQGQGYGSSLISYCINLALSEGKPNLNLDVETHNEKALKLYTRLGFVTQNSCDYWSIDLNKLDGFRSHL